MHEKNCEDNSLKRLEITWTVSALLKKFVVKSDERK